MMKNPKYKENKKNGGVIPPINDKRVLVVPIGCGKCMECERKKMNGWRTRLLEDIKVNKNGRFITLTFSNESIKELGELTDRKGYERDNAIATIGVRRFLERWRKEYGKSLRHFLITELGHNGTENIHIHGIIWTDEMPRTVAKMWKYGYMFPRADRENTWYGNWVSGTTIGYIAKYITKRDFKHKSYKPVILTSAGIGRNYTETYNAKTNRYRGAETNETYMMANGKKASLPIYYRNKIYNDEEREKLWINKLDKGIRYINGNKVKAENITEVTKLLRYYQELNRELGYGDGRKDWEREEYENKMRELNYWKRTKGT